MESVVILGETAAPVVLRGRSSPASESATV